MPHDYRAQSDGSHGRTRYSARRIPSPRSGHTVQRQSRQDIQPSLTGGEDARDANRHATTPIQDLRQRHRSLSERNNLRRLAKSETLPNGSVLYIFFVIVGKYLRRLSAVASTGRLQAAE